MRNPFSGRPISYFSLLVGANVGLLVSYFALIAFVMSYAALTVEFGQEVRDNEAVVASLESSYLSSLGRIQKVDYASLGYAKPVVKVFVPGKPQTALNTR